MSNDPAMNAALLNFCTSLDNGPRGGGPPQRSEEERRWLREALESVEAPERQIKRLLAAVARDDIAEEDCVAALEELAELVEDINWAVEFSLMNGHNVMLGLLRGGGVAAGSAGVRRAAALVIAHASQLNEQVQRRFEEARWHEVLLPLLSEERSPATLAAFLHSCSCLCRDYTPNALLFGEGGGLEVITELLKTTHSAGEYKSKIIKRVLFLLAYLAGVLDVDTHNLARHISVYTVSDDQELQIASARTLIALTNKSSEAVRLALRAVTPECFTNWRNTLLEEDDSRRQLMDILLGEGHEG